MDFRERETSFLEADRRFAELKRQLDAGAISDEEFDAHRRRLMVQDREGYWWAKSRKTGEWNYYDGNAWVPATPPGYQRPQTSATEDTTNRRFRLEQNKPLPPFGTSLVGDVPLQWGDREKPRRGARRRTVIVAGIMGMVVLAVIGAIAIGVEEGLIWGPAYDLVEHESGALSAEVPSDWKERSTIDLEGEKGREAWSSFLGEDESTHPSITAVNDLYSWRNGTPGHQGVYMVASKTLAQKYTDDELVALGPNDYSSSCEAGTPEDFERPPYSGKMLEWKNCNGDSNHTAITLAVAPTGRECVVAAQIGGYFQSQADKEGIQHVLDTLQTDCSKLG